MTRAERRARSAAAVRNQAGFELRATRSLRVHIDEVVLHGFPAGDARRIADGLGIELSRLFAGSGLPSAMAAAHGARLLDAGPIRVAQPHAVSAARIGGQIAGALYGVQRP